MAPYPKEYDLPSEQLLDLLLITAAASKQHEEVWSHRIRLEAVVEWLAREHGVAVIPGSACGMPGFIRVCYGNLAAEACEAACARLGEACAALAGGGGPS